jgi:hypothetical protein
VRLQVETVEATQPVLVSVPDITYDVLSFDPTAPTESRFELPADEFGGESACERQPNDIGFPFVHFFHHYYHA